MLISEKEFRSFYLEKFSLIFELFYKRGMVLWYNNVLELPKCIAKGDEICALRYKKQKTGK